MRTKKLNNKGFTLVEVIVVAVIVAVLALVAIQLYSGYVKEARQNTAENLAASAAGYLQTELNRGNTPTQGKVIGGASVGMTAPTTVTPGVFNVPNNANIQIGANTVTAYVGSSTAQTASNSVAESEPYPWQ